MSQTAVYDTTVTWTGEHWGHIVMGNGPEMDFSAPPDAQGHADVFTPEDAFVASINTCIMMMFIWAANRSSSISWLTSAGPRAPSWWS
jgi:organic hydroperoxide reductase OsmC/OhrA